MAVINEKIYRPQSTHNCLSAVNLGFQKPDIRGVLQFGSNTPSLGTMNSEGSDLFMAFLCLSILCYGLIPVFPLSSFFT